MTRLTLDRIGVNLGGHRVLQDCSLSLAAGEFVGLIGPNGAGKTTLLRTAANLLQPNHGRVLLDDLPLADMAPRQRARSLGYLPQTPTAHWPMTVARLVALGRLPHLEPWRRPAAGDGVAIDQAMQQTDVTGLRNRIFHTLSGGEKVRAMLARVLAAEPQILLADEPLASLDPYHQFQVIDLLRRFADRGHAVIAVLHDLTLAARFCHRLVLLHEGGVAADGPPAAVLSDDNLRRVYRITAWVDGQGDGLRVVPRAIVRPSQQGDVP
jgi:iron complex transport system ATP-binding protein